ncbi:MAG: peptide chain release factor family protein [Verrucomicrobiota bacterium]
MDQYISGAKQARLAKRMAELGIGEDQLDEKFILGSGKGGQKINKTASCVQLRHKGHGIEVRCQKSRSRAMNRYFARKELCDKIEDKIEGRKSAKRRKEEKIRRQKRRRSRKQKAKMLEEKRKRSGTKALRRNVDMDREM